MVERKIKDVKRRARVVHFFLIVLCVYLLNYPNASLSGQEQRVALVIGNGSYASSPLANPVNDAMDMAKFLEKCNFYVMKAINADRKEMRRVIRKFGDKINRGAVGLFYYAGHGIQVNGENYLVPIGAEVFSEAEVEDECLKVSSMLRQMETAGNRLNIIILDACRDNPFGRSFRSSGMMGLAKMDAPTGSIIAYATAPGSVAADGSDRNGLFTSYLLKHMIVPGLPIERVFKQIRLDVMKASGKRQVPWESSSLTGDFYFMSKRGIAVVTTKPIVHEKPLRITSHPKNEIQDISLNNSEVVKEFVFEPNLKLMLQTGQSAERLSWRNAVAYCKGLNLANYNDWRLPTRDELERIVNKQPYLSTHSVTGKVFVDVKRFPSILNLTHPTYWTRTEKGNSFAYCVSFSEGSSELSSKSANYYVKAVRDAD